MRRGPPKLPPIRVWIERVDADCIAVLATCFKVRPKMTKEEGRYVRRPFLFGYSKFFLTAPDRYWRLEELAVEHIGTIAAERNNWLPPIGKCTDLAGWGDYE